MPVNTTHPQYARALERWRTTRDACDPEQIKKERERYLPLLADHKEDPNRFDAYLARAYYVNITGRTRDGLTGAVFRNGPTHEIPAQLEYLLEDADGSGQSLEQLAKHIVSEVMMTGRYGVLVDYPEAMPGMSLEQTRDLRAHIACYRAEDIINWKFTTESGRLKLTLVVLAERDDDEIDEFEYREVSRYRVLRLVDGVYTQQLYDEGYNPLEDPRQPTQSDGSAWTHIPFHFIGAESNRPEVGVTPLFDLAMVNIAQYRNIADREETLHIAGQPTLFVTSDIDLETFRQANPNGIRVGARKGHFLGPNGNAMLLQAQAVDAHDRAIDQKAEQMVSIGARLVIMKGGNQTAEAARIDASGQHSVLSTLVGNVSEALEAALEDCARYMGGEPDGVQYSLNRDFWDEGADPQLMIALIQSADRGDIAQTDLRRYYRRTGIIEATRTDEEIDQDVAAQAPTLAE
jgi:hypothetical protein